MAEKKAGVMDLKPLMEVIRTLRAPGGCPWDRVQTHQSIRQNFIEETYEVIEAIDSMPTRRFRKDGFTLYVYGICSSCQAKLRRHADNKNKKVIQKPNKKQ